MIIRLALVWPISWSDWPLCAYPLGHTFLLHHVYIVTIPLFVTTDQPSGTSQWERPVESSTTNVSSIKNSNSNSSGNLSQHSGSSGSSHSNSRNNNNNNNRSNKNQLSRSEKSVDSVYTANSTDNQLPKKLPKRRESVSVLDKLKISQKEQLDREEIIRQLEEDNKDIKHTQPSLYINTQPFSGSQEEPSHVSFEDSLSPYGRAPFISPHRWPNLDYNNNNHFTIPPLYHVLHATISSRHYLHTTTWPPSSPPTGDLLTIITTTRSYNHNQTSKR